MKKLHDFNEVFDGQAVFRKVLEAMANPGRRVSIAAQAEKLYGNNRTFLALAMTLLDNEVCFYTCQNEELSKDISLLTLSEEKALEDADVIFVEREESLLEVFENAKCGTLADPHKSATIVIKADGSCEKDLSLYGAGIDGILNLKIPKTVDKAIALRDEQAYEYPEGIDMIFVTDDGELFAIPRLVLKKEEN